MASKVGSAKLAIDGGTAVHSTGWLPWPEVSEARWRDEVEPLMRGVYLSRTEGLPNPHARAFEQTWCAYSGVGHAVLTSHGTDALQAAVAGALDADSIGYAGEVLCPHYTFIASATAPLSVQCGVVLVDADPTTFTIDPAAIEAAITERTVGIMAVHLAGHPCDLDTINAIAAKHGLAVIEDCAQAHGAKLGDRQVGGIGTVGGFSYQSSKNLTSGEGGLVTTNDEEVFNRAYAYLNIGRFLGGARWEHPRIGWNYRSNEYMACLLQARMSTFDEECDRRDANGAYLNSLLERIPGLTPPRRAPWCGRHAYHLYICQYDSDAFGGHSRAEFLKALNAEGIPSGVGYDMPLGDQPGMQAVAERHPDRLRCEPCPQTERIIEWSVWLTQNMLLGSRQDMDDIATAVAKIQAAWTA